ncbi:hypothetical protein GCM10022402_11630 [Salinactinospora qingdaonensis]|uniref:Uncharacterized protein n=1 Tax=Salinactinospora qingdaonensis TaxID=702744 RepID=A0ABP7FAB6_9ACTN
MRAPRADRWPGERRSVMAGAKARYRQEDNGYSEIFAAAHSAFCSPVIAITYPLFRLAAQTTVDKGMTCCFFFVALGCFSFPGWSAPGMFFWSFPLLAATVTMVYYFTK